MMASRYVLSLITAALLGESSQACSPAAAVESF